MAGFSITDVWMNRLLYILPCVILFALFISALFAQSVTTKNGFGLSALLVPQATGPRLIG